MQCSSHLCDQEVGVFDVVTLSLSNSRFLDLAELIFAFFFDDHLQWRRSYPHDFREAEKKHDPRFGTPSESLVFSERYACQPELEGK